MARIRWKRTKRSAAALGVLAGLGAGAALVAPDASAASDSWVGSALPGDELWSETFRWAGNTSPGAGETATFPQDAAGKAVDVDAGEGANVAFTGAGFSLSDAAAPVIPPVHWPVITSSTPGSNFVSVGDIDLGGSTITMSNGGTLEFLQGVDVSGDDLTISGDGHVVFRRDPMSDIDPLVGDADVITSVTDFEIDSAGVLTWGGDLRVTGGTATLQIPSGNGALIASGGTTDLNATYFGPISVSGQGRVNINSLAAGGATVTGAGTLVVPAGVTLSEDVTVLTHPVDGNGTTFCGGNLVGAVNILGGVLELGSGDDAFDDCQVLGDGVLFIVPSFTMGAGGALAVDVGVDANSQDQLFAEGPVTLGGAALDLDASADLVPGTVVTILSNDEDDPIVGTFAGLAEGDVVTSNGRSFLISYEGGTGNDVTLEALPTISIEGPVQGPEGALGDGNTLEFTVALTAPVESDVTFDVLVNGVLATEDVDFEVPAPADLSVTIPGSEGATEATITVPIIGDDLDELDENLAVRIVNVEGVEVGEDQAIGVILDDDAAPVLTVDDVEVVEGDAGTVDATFTFTLSEASGQAFLALASTVPSSATSPADYAALEDVVVLFLPGDVSEEVTVVVAGDLVDEIDETFFLQLHDFEPVGAVAPASDTGGQGTIDDDDGPTVSITDETSLESVDAEFFVTLSAASPQDVSVDYQVVPGTATAEDLVIASGTVTVPAGDVEALLVVDVLPDTEDEPDEAYTVVLGDPVDGVVAAAAADDVVAAAGGTGNGVITDDDLPPATTTTSTTATTAPAVGGSGTGRGAGLPRTGVAGLGVLLSLAGVLIIVGSGARRRSVR